MSTTTSPATTSPTASAGVAARADTARKVYATASTDAGVVALDDVTVSFAAGAFTAIMGPSGSGKSTLMHCLAGLDTLTSRPALIGDTDLAALSDRELTLLRRDRLGFVFQAFNLLPTLTAAREHHPARATSPAARLDPAWFDHVVATARPRRPARPPPERAVRRSAAAGRHRPRPGRPARTSCSPTSPPAPSTRRPAPSSSRSCARAVDDLGQTVVMVTHDPVAAAYADRVVFLADGRIVDELDQPTARRVLETMKRLGD